MVEKNEVEQTRPSIGGKVVPHEEMCGYTRCINHLELSRDACVLYGWSIEDDGNNGSVTFFEGPILMGNIIAVVNFLTPQTIPVKSLPGIELDNGLSVQFTGHVTSVTVFWRPRREREAG